MNKHCLVSAVLAACLVAGCIPTLHPVYTGEDIVFDELLVGSWQADDGSTRWQFTRGSGKAYRLVLTDRSGKTGEFESHLTRFEGLTYLDLCPTDKGISGNDVYKAYLLPLHTFFRVDRLDKGELQMSSVDGRWLEQKLVENPEVLSHERIKGGFLVTATSEDLQAFLKQHQDTAGAFSKVSVLKRQTD
jgi:hypothetical protein